MIARSWDEKPSEELARHFDTLDPSIWDDPYPIYAKLRQCPIARSDLHGGYWILSRYEDVLFAYERPEIFSSFPNPIPEEFGRDRKLIPLEIDPPEHVGYRHILAPLFAPPRINLLEPEIRKETNALIDSFLDRGGCEFIEEFAKPLPTTVFLHLVGWPLEDAELFTRWNEEIIHGVAGDLAATLAVREEAGLALYSYFAEIIDARTEQRQEDVVSYLLDATYDDERPLTQFEILDMVFLFLIGGLDTTKSVLGNSFAYLAEHPEHRRQIASDPGVIRSAIEELMRWETPVAPGRRVARDFVMHGVELKEGDRVLLLPGATGRDEGEFPDADRVILDRHPNRHLAFGAGIHRCAGSHLARLTLRVAFEEFHRRIPDYRIPAGGRIVRHVGHVRGVDRLPLEFVQ